jgi:hypothetical protein
MNNDTVDAINVGLRIPVDFLYHEADGVALETRPQIQPVQSPC